MQNLRKRFGGLYWRLTGSYFLVTLLAAIIVEIAVTLPSSTREYQQANDTFKFIQMLEYQEAPLLAPFFTQHTPDASALHTALSQIDEQIDEHIAENFGGQQEPSLLFYLGLVDSKQQVLATDAPCAQASATISEQVQNCTPQDPKQSLNDTFIAPIRATLEGDTRQAHWMAVSSRGILLAVPIRAESSGGGPVVGALVAVIHLQGNTSASSSSPSSGISQFLTIFWSQLQANGLYFILLASVVGTITGLLITRNVTRRLRRITQAAEAWSNGDFAVAVDDPTRDEIGQLGQDLNGMAEQLHALVATQHRMAVLGERQRWQRDLHDAVKQQLFAATMQIAAARACFATDTQQSYGHIIEAEHLAGQAQRELTTLIQAVQPNGLAGKPFAEVLDDLCQQWSRQAGIPMELQVEGQCDLPPDAEVALYRVVQEALANVQRHSAATHVAVRLHEVEEPVTLAVRDNGQGFDPTVDTAGFGLRSMRERMADLGGDLVVASSREGTQITARLFRRQEADNDA
jgi:two-component system, NarL family, sensor histidine kinase LiaS